MTIPETMRALVLTGHGGLDKLELRDDWPVPKPVPGEGPVAVMEANGRLRRPNGLRALDAPSGM